MWHLQGDKKIVLVSAKINIIIFNFSVTKSRLRTVHLVVLK